MAAKFRVFLDEDHYAGYFNFIKKRCRHATYPATGYFQCKENHFETRAITLYLFVEIYPSAVPRQYFSISTLYAKLSVASLTVLSNKSCFSYLFVELHL